MQHRLASILLFCTGMTLLSPAQALPGEIEILLLLTGPISEAVQETVLLIRRGDNFITPDSLAIGCIAGASAGWMATAAPGLAATGVVHSIVSTGPMAGVLGCGMSIVGAVAGMATAWFLEKSTLPKNSNH